MQFNEVSQALLNQDIAKQVSDGARSRRIKGEDKDLATNSLIIGDTDDDKDDAPAAKVKAKPPVDTLQLSADAAPKAV